MAANVIRLRPDPLPVQPIGRLLECASCGELVDVIEIDVGGTGRSMRPDVCGECIVAGADPEPRIEAVP